MTAVPDKAALRIEERMAGPTAVVSPAGRLDATGAPILETRMSAIVARGTTRVVLDGRGLTYLSSAGLRALVVSAQSCRKEGGDLAVAELDPRCRSVMEASGLLSVLDYHDTVEAALAAPGDGVGLDIDLNQPASDGVQAMTIEEWREEPAVVLAPAGRLDGAGARLWRPGSQPSLEMAGYPWSSTAPA